MVEIEVRTCTADEVAVLSGLEPPARGFAAQAYANQVEGRSTFLVAWDGDDPCGSGEVTRGGCPVLANLNVRPESRNRGVGTALVRAAEIVASPAGELSIGVGSDNHDALRLYARLGYVATGHTDTTTYTYIDDENEPHTETEVTETLRTTW